jgi:uncharacterized protein (TIGR01319 family)
MAHILLIDFGSTFTKLTAVCTTKQDVIGSASHFTTVDTDIRIGYHNALDELTKRLGFKPSFDEVIACSSAAGGLKMAAIGLIEELTVEAAKRVCLGAGAKVDLVYSHHLNKSEVREIVEHKTDIILLAGGADGGNSECVLFNARLLGQMGVKIPIIYAGNKSCIDEIEEIFTEFSIDGYFAENVMPKINQLNIHSARERIRLLFLEKIIEAKGIKMIESEIDKVILPTPEAVLQAATLLAKGYGEEQGIGEIVMVDIGGATTDMYSISHPTRRGDVVLHGLEEPFAKRTVEGDLGMRYSAKGILKSLSKEEIHSIKQSSGIDIEAEINYLSSHVDALPQSEHQEVVDTILAQLCTYKAMSRHAGKMEEVYTPLGKVYNQTGKDLSMIETVIGTGGVVINAKNPTEILAHATNIHHHPFELRPEKPRYYLDKDYLMSAMGLLSQKEPILALQIMKKHLLPLN